MNDLINTIDEIACGTVSNYRIEVDESCVILRVSWYDDGYESDYDIVSDSICDVVCALEDLNLEVEVEEEDCADYCEIKVT